MGLPERSITKEGAAAASLAPRVKPEATPQAAAGAEEARAPAASRPPARRRRPSRPTDRLFLQPEVRTIFVSTSWKTGVRMTDEQRASWLRKRRVRELVMLTMLSEHRFLTTQQLRALFWPTGQLRSAQLHLRRLSRDLRLIMRWPQVEPVAREETLPTTWWGFRHHTSVWLLTELGAAVAAAYRRLDHGALVRRSFYAAQTTQPEHTLGVNGFWVSLAAAAAAVTDEGLYTWEGDDAVRGMAELEGSDLRPDGWGRYLTPEREIRWSLEWDAGTEPPKRLAQKARAFQDHYKRIGVRPETTHVLVVLSVNSREDSIAEAIQKALPAKPSVRFWTTHAGLLRNRGPLGEVWREVAGGGGRVRLPELPGRPRTSRRVEDCLAKPNWWERRPGGGGGA